MIIKTLLPKENDPLLAGLARTSFLEELNRIDAEQLERWETGLL